MCKGTKRETEQSKHFTHQLGLLWDNTGANLRTKSEQKWTEHNATHDLRGQRFVLWTQEVNTTIHGAS